MVVDSMAICAEDLSGNSTTRFVALKKVYKIQFFKNYMSKIDENLEFSIKNCNTAVHGT